MVNKGIIAINKPKDWTSFDVVNKIKHMLKIKQVGHLGTLDPMATGVLLVTVGKATKLFDLMQEKQKTYVATFKFGVLTDTLDSTGKEINRAEFKHISLKDIEQVLSKFIGEISQIPPKYSAKSINGKRAYDLARSNQDFELKPKLVKVYDIKILDFDGENLKLEICCGSGTYIRAIGRDLASELNTYATMTDLIRTGVGSVTLENCQDITTLNADNISKFIKPINQFINLNEISLNEIEKKKILNGMTIIIDIPDGNYILNEGENTLAVVKILNNHAKMLVFLG